MRLPQQRSLRRIADQRQPAFVGVLRQLLGIGVDDDKRQRLARQLARRTAPHASCAAQNVVIRKPADLAIHASPAENRL